MSQYLIELGADPMHNALHEMNPLQAAVMRCLIPEVQFFIENYPQLLRLPMYEIRSVLELAVMTTKVPQSAQLVNMLLQHFKPSGKLLETAATHSTSEVLQVLLEQHITDYDLYQDHEKWSECVGSAVKHCLRHGYSQKLKVLSEFYLKYGSKYPLKNECWHVYIPKGVRSRKVLGIVQHTKLFLDEQKIRDTIVFIK